MLELWVGPMQMVCRLTAQSPWRDLKDNQRRVAMRERSLRNQTCDTVCVLFMIPLAGSAARVENDFMRLQARAQNREQQLEGAMHFHQGNILTSLTEIKNLQNLGPPDLFDGMPKRPGVPPARRELAPNKGEDVKEATRC